ncbi:pol protein [Cucumis melo var. makuwa]|uniref:Pol protein n=1 Tax=Cucumis melo var. makuwa TaxID=1194695 RepID=A0A5D3DS31_CUCMM|nr:pol protein [Cucumis melo var. makuwa]TYK26486.1 pol protein [Cucumis melo var. makuwa]
MSLNERAGPSKAAQRGLTLGQKRKTELQPTITPQRNLRLEGVFQWHRREIAAIERTLTELHACCSYGRSHGGRCLLESRVRFKWKQLGYTIDFCPQKLLGTISNQTSTSQQGRFFPTTCQEAEQASPIVTAYVFRMTSAELEELKAEHEKHLHQGLETLRANQLYANFSKFLTVPNGSGSFVIYSDATKKRLGCVLMQQGLAAMGFALKIWRHYFFGEKIQIFADYKCLKYFFIENELNMRQRRWLKLVKDYDCKILYHPDKANVVTDAFSRKVSHSAALITEQTSLLRDFERAEIAVSHCLAEARQDEEFSISSDDGLMFERRLCVPIEKAVKIELLTEAYSSSFSMHPGRWKWESVSMDFIPRLPRTLKGYMVIWVVVDKLTKSAHFIPGKSTYTTKILVSLQNSRRDFRLPWARGSWDSHLHLMEFVYNNSYQATIGMTPFETLYGRCCRSPICWGEVGEQRMLGLKLVQNFNATIQKIKDPPIKGFLRFEKKGKLSPRFVGPFEILERIGPVAYRLTLPPSFSAVHDVFYVYMLRKYVANPTHVVDFEPLQIKENLSYEEQPVEILARELKMLRYRGIALVKVLRRNLGAEEVT